MMEADPLAPPAPYPGAYASTKQFLESFPGQIQLEDILDESGEDYLYVEQEFGGMPVPLSQLSGAPNLGAAPPNLGGAPTPDAATEMRDLLLDRAKNRKSASESFQSKAKDMMGGSGGSGFEY